MTTKYIMLFERFEYPAGTIVYDLEHYDYGVSNDDMRASGGINHRSVTLRSDGDYPGFTIPEFYLKEIE